MFHQPEIRWLGGYSPRKPPFGVRSCEVGIIHPDQSNIWREVELRLRDVVALLDDSWVAVVE